MDWEQYQCQITSVEGFVQQIACSLLQHGYRWYVTGVIPEHKDPRRTDRKIIEQYDLAVSRRQRTRLRQHGVAAVQYLRYGHQFAIIATKGRHPFREAHRRQIRDIHTQPLLFEGYSISYRPGGMKPRSDWQNPEIPEQDHRRRAHVRIRQSVYREIRERFLYLAPRRSAAQLAAEFQRVPFEPYSPILGQLNKIRRDVNAVRKPLGYELIDKSAIRYRRRVVKPFASVISESHPNPAHSDEGPEDLHQWRV